jgi:hypothetical protein
MVIVLSQFTFLHVPARMEVGAAFSITIIYINDQGQDMWRK